MEAQRLHRYVNLSMNLALGVLALVLSVILVRRELSSSPEAEHDGALPRSVATGEWERWGRSGHWIGDSTAAVRIVVFADYECPYCAKFHDAFIQAQVSLGESIALLHIHYPLKYHDWAIPAARMAECAASQGRFAQMHGALYREQVRTEPRGWGLIIRDVGGIDEGEFQSCLVSETGDALIAAGRQLGDSIGVTGTPTIIINGDRYLRPPTDSLEQVLRSYAAK